MNLLKIINVFFSEKKQAELLVNSNSSDGIYNILFIHRYKQYYQIENKVTFEEFIKAHELFILFLFLTTVLGLTHYYFVSLFNSFSYIVLMFFSITVLILSFFHGKITLFRKNNTEISMEYITEVQKKELHNVIDEKKTVTIKNTAKNRL